MDYYQHSQRPSALYTIDRRLKSSTGVPIPPRCNGSISNCHGSVMYFTYLKRAEGTLKNTCYLSNRRCYIQHGPRWWETRMELIRPRQSPFSSSPVPRRGLGRVGGQLWAHEVAWGQGGSSSSRIAANGLLSASSKTLDIIYDWPTPEVVYWVPIPTQVQRIYFKLPRLCDVFYELKTHRGDSKAPLLPQWLKGGISNMVNDDGKQERSSYGHAKVHFRHLLCFGMTMGA